MKEWEHPLVTDGIAQWAEEGDGEVEVSEGEPVGSVGARKGEWMLFGWWA
jgi:hypothetical protein